MKCNVPILKWCTHTQYTGLLELHCAAEVGRKCCLIKHNCLRLVATNSKENKISFALFESPQW